MIRKIVLGEVFILVSTSVLFYWCEILGESARCYLPVRLVTHNPILLLAMLNVVGVIYVFYLRWKAKYQNK